MHPERLPRAAGGMAAPMTGPSVGPIDKKIAHTMEVVAQQLKVTLDTLAVFERRLRRNEDSIAEISATQKQIVEMLRRQDGPSSE